MTQYNFTLNSEQLHHLFLGNHQDNGVSQLLESVLNQVLQAQATEQLNAEHYERTEEREAYRNGSYSRQMKTRAGNLTLKIPRIRNGQFSTSLFMRYQRSEQAFVLALMEMVVNGVSTRKVTKITEELCGTEFSKSTISELCKNLDPIVADWNERPLQGAYYPFILVDAIVMKVRENGVVRPRAVMVAIGISIDGHREILGIKVGDSESEQGWSEFFCWLKSRGLTDVDFVVSDHHAGLIKAIEQHFQGVIWQRCQAHFIKNILDASPKSLKKEIRDYVRLIFNAPDKETARLLLNQTLERFEGKAPKAMETLERGFEDATAVLALPETYRTKLRTTNAVERLNEEIRRRERVIRIFPNRESVLRLIGAYLMEIDERWLDQKYLDMKEYMEWKAAQGVSEVVIS